MFSCSIFDFAFDLSHILHVAFFVFYAIHQIRTIACYVVYLVVWVQFVFSFSNLPEIFCVACILFSVSGAVISGSSL